MSKISCVKRSEDVVEILEAYDLLGSYRAAAEAVGCDHHTVRRYVKLREAGNPRGDRAKRSKPIDEYLPKIEELVERSNGKVRADVVHERLLAMGFEGGERTTRRMVAAVKDAYRSGHRRVFRPWVPEPGLWLQWDWGHGPKIRGRQTTLWCAWLAWSRFRVVLPVFDKTLPTVIGCLDATLRRLGGVPTYALTDNEKTVTTEHIARIAVRHPEIVEVGRHYGLTIRTCMPADPQSKGGSEATVRIAKADLVPTEANLRGEYRGVRGVGAGLPAVLRGGQRPGSPGDPPGTRRRVGRGTAAAASAAGPGLHVGVRADPAGQLGRHRATELRALFGSPPAG
jgi:transposase